MRSIADGLNDIKPLNFRSAEMPLVERKAFDIRPHTVTGYVASGRGLASKHIKDAQKSFVDATGDTVFPGSLNVLLKEPILLDPQFARTAEDGKRLLWRAFLSGLPVWIYRWPHAPLHVAEVLSSSHLRTALNLQDGDSVDLCIPQSHLMSLSFRRRAAWHLIWKSREAWCYTNGGYYRRTKRFSMELGATQSRIQKNVFRVMSTFVRRGFK